jgi:hypothetical protein
VVGIERLGLISDDQLVPPQLAVPMRTGRAAFGAVKTCEVLCVGDSILQFGAIPRAFEQCLRRSAYNLSIAGGQPPGSYFMLRRALSAGARPAAIVVDFKACLIAMPPRENRRMWVEVLTLAECAEIGLAQGDATELASILLCKLIPSYKARQEIRSFVLALLYGERPPSHVAVAQFLRNANVNKGAVVASDSFRAPWRPQEVIEREFLPDTWDIDPVNAHYIRRLLELADSRHIPVFWVLGPIRAELQIKRDAKGLEAAYVRRVNEFCARFPNLYVIDARHAGFPDTAFWDPMHLDRSGALALSCAVARVIDTVLNRPNMLAARRFELPPFQDVTIDAPVEDLDASCVVLGLAPGGARR